MPSTPLLHRQSPDDQQSSPFLPLSTARQLSERTLATLAKDPLLHRILDKNDGYKQRRTLKPAASELSLSHRVMATETPRPEKTRSDTYSNAGP